MKKIRYFIIGSLTLALTILIACDKDNLDLAPSAPTETEYFLNANQFKRAIYGAYAKMCDIFSYNNNQPLVFVWLLPGDDVTSSGVYSYEVFDGNSTSDTRITQFFEYQYQLINRVNLYIQKYYELENPQSLDDYSGILQGLGEAHFLRAYWYLNLMNYYGKNIPLIKDIKVLGVGVTKEDLMYPSAGDYLTILNSCIEDAIEATKYLPSADQIPSQEKGRATVDAAYGLLGKLYMFRACYGDQSAADYASAIQAFNNIDAAYDLMPNFGDNFDVEQENNMESLFEYQASNAPSLDNIWLANDFDLAIGRMSVNYSGFDNTWGVSGWNSGGIMMPTSKLIEAFDTITGANDYRFEETVQPAGAPFTIGFMINKFTKYSQGAGDFASFSSTNNLRLMRMADIFLLKAEALAQTGQPSEAIALVNKIRERARNSNPNATTEPADRSTGETNVATIMDWIMTERQLELACEGHRWPDLKRWDEAGYIDLGTWDADDFGTYQTVAFNFSYPNDAVYPIPESELNNNANITQNDGY